MSTNETIRTGLWKKESNNGGAPYYGGKVEVGGVEFWVNLYKNDRKESDKHPDLTLQLKPVEASYQSTNKAATPSQADPFRDDPIPFDGGF